jgi:hypothetical protein
MSKWAQASTAPFNMYQNYYYAGNSSRRYFTMTKLETLNKIISGVFAFYAVWTKRTWQRAIKVVAK